MTEEREGRVALRIKSAEIAVAALFLMAGVLVMYDSVRLGATWGEYGPKPGDFPFYLGLIMTVAAVMNLARGFMIPADKNPPFVLAGQLKMVLTVLVPAAVYAAAIGWIGIYVASILFIAFFMRWLGKFAWWKVAAVSAGTAVALFLIFERWFLVPLPKGPIEAFLGLN